MRACVCVLYVSVPCDAVVDMLMLSVYARDCAMQICKDLQKQRIKKYCRYLSGVALIQSRSGAGVTVKLSIDVEPVHGDGSMKAHLLEAASDWE